MRVGLLTVSDRSARGERPDRSGPLLRQAIEAEKWSVVRAEIVADEPRAIQEILSAWADSQEVDLILTTGGTGFAPRDRTPEATRAVIEREAPGLAEAMRLSGLRSTAHAMLSRAVAGIRGRTLIINLPGSPKAALEGLDVLRRVLPHAIDLLTEQAAVEQGHNPPSSVKT